MADNVAITPGTGATVAADEVAGALHQRVKISVGADGTAADWEGLVSNYIARPSGNFTRPSDTTAYASGDLVANSVTAGSVDAVSIAVARASGGTGSIRRALLRKSGTGITNSIFRIHLYEADPSTVTNGDNGAWSTSGVADYLGAIDVVIDRAFTDGAAGEGVPLAGGEINFDLTGTANVYALLEARGAYTPASAEVFTIELEVLQN